MTFTRLMIAALLVGGVSGCVGKGVHDEVLAQLAQRTLEYEMLQSVSDATQADLEAQLTRCRGQVNTLTNELEMTREEIAQCRQHLQDARGALHDSDAATRRLAERLEELAAIESELRERDAIFRSIVDSFRSLIDNGYVEVVIERGRLVIKMPQDILFESGSATVGPTGQEALVQVAQVLATLTARTFQVEGHTDNVPINSQRFPSNWELSAGRALAVVHLFEANGVPPQNISAGAFGEWRPRASNETTTDKALNRRIEIVMVPDLEAIFGNIVQ